MQKPIPSPFRLDLGCGQTKPAGWEGIDIVALPGVDVVHDLEIYPWPIPDNSVDELRASHYVEHVSDFCKFMDEAYRILKPPSKDEHGKTVQGGKFDIIVPFCRSDRAFQDPTHKQFISEARFLYVDKKWREDNKLDHYPIRCDFEFKFMYAFYPEWQSRPEEARNFAIRHYWNVISDLYVTLWKR